MRLNEAIIQDSQVVQWFKKKKNLPARAGDKGGEGSIPGLGRCLGAGNGKSVFLPGQRRLVSYSPWGHKESEVTEYACMQPLSIGLLSA